MDFSTIIFDLDDTLYPPSSGIWDLISNKIHQYMIERLDIDPAVVSEVRTSYYTRYGTTMRGLITHYQIDPQDYLDFVHQIPIQERIKPNTELKKMLQSLPQRKIVFTNSDYNHADRVLKLLGIRELFELVVDVIDVSPYCKPMPEAFTIALNQMRVSPQQCIFVDDSIKNLNAAKNLGLFTVLPNADTTLAQQPHATIRNITDLVSVLPNGAP